MTVVVKLTVTPDVLNYSSVSGALQLTRESHNDNNLEHWHTLLHTLLQYMYNLN